MQSPPRAPEIVYELPEDCNTMELVCLASTGIWMPAMFLRIDETMLTKGLFDANPIRFKRQFRHTDWSKVKFSEKEDLPDTSPTESNPVQL
jgi:hypothetical protein